MSLRARVIRLAKQRQDLRKVLLPLLRVASSEDTLVKMMVKMMVMLFKESMNDPSVSPMFLEEAATDLREDIKKLVMSAQGGRLQLRLLVLFAQDAVMFVKTLAATQRSVK